MKRRPASLTLALLAATSFGNMAFARTAPHATRPAAAAASQPADAGPPPTAPLAIPGVPMPPNLPQQAAYVLMDANTGAVIAAKAPEKAWPPASLTKLMTAYLTYQAIARGTLKMDQTVPISTTAWHTGGSRMFISPDMTVTVDQLLHGLIIDSGNDAAVALSEAVAGSQEGFVGLMNHEAKALGLSGTHYTDVDGLPNPALRTTALDVARLSRNIVRTYPQFLKISAQKYYTFDKIRQRSWNPVLFHDASVDGLKTGRTDEAGHCIDATALRNGRRLIAVVLGGPSWSVSTHDIEALLDYGYQFYTNVKIVQSGHAVAMMPVPTYRETRLPVGPAHDVTMTIPALAAKSLKTSVTYDAPPRQGVRRGQTVGTVTISAGNKTLITVPAIALADDPRAGIVTRMIRRLKASL